MLPVASHASGSINHDNTDAGNCTSNGFGLDKHLKQGRVSEKPDE